VYTVMSNENIHRFTRNYHVRLHENNM
jgi:hypothetical protein